jgi:hypothetical protein
MILASTLVSVLKKISRYLSTVLATDSRQMPCEEDLTATHGKLVSTLYARGLKNEAALPPPGGNEIT